MRLYIKYGSQELVASIGEIVIASTGVYDVKGIRPPYTEFWIVV